MEENVLELQLVQFGSAAFAVIDQCLHEAFLDSDSMGLADEGVAQQAFETINERHVLGKPSDEGGKFQSILFPEVSSQHEEVGPQF